MDRKLKSAVIFALASCAASPASANAPTATPVSLLIVLAMPLLVLALTAAGGAGKVMTAKGHRRWKTWEIVVSMIILFILAPVVAPVFMFFLSLVALARSIQMLVWGYQARKPAAERKPFLAEAEPGRLMGAGAGLLALTVVLFVVFWLDFTAGQGTWIRKLREGSTKGNLSAIRAAVSTHQAEKGSPPSSLEALSEGGKYLAGSLPQASVADYHRASNAVLTGTAPDDAGGWLYNADPKDKGFGTVLVNCTHTDSKGTVWTAY
ncbi:MAG: hypothetical protein HY924_07115 [Elusimicrobia bacterium]|nr:hypothetical protein [Elusimicrobiota bacterium]